jgi:arylsulfatase A-like enzyme
MYSHKAPHREWVPGPDFYNAYKDVEIPLPTNFYDDYKNRTSALREQEMEVANHMNPNDLKLVEPKYMNEEQLVDFRKAYDAANEVFHEANLEGKALAEWKYQRYMKAYLGSITSMDHEIGRVLEYLETSGLVDNTVIMYSSDQGFYLGDHGWYDKRWMYEESLRMPLLVRWPEVIEPGSVNTQLTQNLDFAETILDIAGTSIPSDMQGRSLVPLLMGKKPIDWRNYIYYHYYAYPDWHMVRQHYGIRSDQYKLIHYYTLNEWELFDLKADPNEMYSVYDNPDYGNIQSKMTSDLLQMKKLTGDTIELKTSSKYHGNAEVMERFKVK